MQEKTFDFSSMSEQEMQSVLEQYQIILTCEEALKIQQDVLKRPPTLSECTLWSIQCSEYCSYKSTQNYLKQFSTKAPNVLLEREREGAGVVTIATDEQGHRYVVVVSHESPNCLSHLVPYEGAATGVGENLSKVSCMGARVIAMADSLRFGDVNLPKTQWLHEGIIAGIASYGNPAGIPNIAGDVSYHPGYNENCLVTVTTLGLAKEEELIHSVVPKDIDLEVEDYELILVGKPTDNSGFCGARFASAELESDKASQGVAQEPNAFLGRHLLKAHYALFDILKERKLIKKVGFKDLGVGGIACASVEIVNGHGAELLLDHVPISLEGLPPSMVLCSETQERYLWAVPASMSELVLDHYNKAFDLPNVSSGSAAVVIGKVRNDGWYKVRYKNQLLIDIKVQDVTSGIFYDRPIKDRAIKFTEPCIGMPEDCNDMLLSILTHENVACSEMVYENYDKQVQGRTYLERGVAAAGVIQPFNSDDYSEELQLYGIALAVSHNPAYNDIDPYFGAMNAVARALRKVAIVGASPQALTACLCYGNPEKPEHMGDFSEGVCGIVDACKDYLLKEHPGNSIPIITESVSLYNESKTQGSIPPSPMLSCIGVMKDVTKAITRAFKQQDSCILMVGDRQDELGGSVYYQLHNQLGSQIPAPKMTLLTREIHALTDAIESGLILAADVIDVGGLAATIAIMSAPNKIGANIHVPSELSQDLVLFSETSGFVLEVAPENLDAVEQIFSHYHVGTVLIGHTNPSKKLLMQDCIDLSVVFSEQAWRNGLREKIL